VGDLRNQQLTQARGRRVLDLVRDILFKFSMDSRGFFQSDDAAAKLAGM
jgi:hypothetical protein